MFGRLQRQVGRKLRGQHASSRFLCKLEVHSVTNVPSSFKHVKVLWQSEGREDKASSGICAVSSGAAMVRHTLEATVTLYTGQVVEGGYDTKTIILKLQGGTGSGPLQTLCKKAVDVAPHAGSDEFESELISLSMPFTKASGFGNAAQGQPLAAGPATTEAGRSSASLHSDHHGEGGPPPQAPKMSASALTLKRIDMRAKEAGGESPMIASVRTPQGPAAALDSSPSTASVASELQAVDILPGPHQKKTAGQSSSAAPAGGSGGQALQADSVPSGAHVLEMQDSVEEEVMSDSGEDEGPDDTPLALQKGTGSLAAEVRQVHKEAAQKAACSSSTDSVPDEHAGPEPAAQEQDCQVRLQFLDLERQDSAAATDVGDSSRAHEVSAAGTPKEAEDGLPDWWTLSEQPKRKVRSDLPPRPDQAVAADARASPPGSGSWERLSRVAERQDEEEACTAVAELEAELAYLGSYVAELEAANEALRQAAAGQLQGAGMQQDGPLQEGGAGRRTADEDKGGLHALRQLCRNQHALLEALTQDKLAMGQALADAQRRAEQAGHDSSMEGQQEALQAQLWEAEAAISTKEEKLHALERANRARQQELQASEEAAEDLRGAMASQVQQSQSLAAEAAQARAQLQRQRGEHAAEARSACPAVHAEAQSRVEDMRQAARDARAAHGAEAELQSEQYEALAAQLRRIQAAAAEQLDAMREEAAEAKSQAENSAALARDEASALQGDLEQLRQALVEAEGARDAAVAALEIAHPQAATPSDAAPKRVASKAGEANVDNGVQAEVAGAGWQRSPTGTGDAVVRNMGGARQEPGHTPRRRLTVNLSTESSGSSQAWSPRSAAQDVEWLHQCCTSLAEQLRVAQASNAELQAEVEALRAAEMGSARSSPMAWEGPSAADHLHNLKGGPTERHSLSAAAFDAALAMDTGSISSGSSGRSSGGGQLPGRGAAATSRPGGRQRGLQAEVAALQEQLHVAAAMQAEQEREIALLRAEGGAEEVAAAVGVATAAAQREMAALQRHCAELRARLEAAQEEAAEAYAESLEARQGATDLEAALRDSEAHRHAMLAEKRQLEGQLLRTAGEVAAAERELLSGSRRASPAASADGGAIEAYLGDAATTPARPRLLGYRTPLPEDADADDSDDSDFEEEGSSEDSAAMLVPKGISRLAERSARETAALRGENDALMRDLVATKMELAQLHEQLLLATHTKRGTQDADGPQK